MPFVSAILSLLLPLAATPDDVRADEVARQSKAQEQAGPMSRHEMSERLPPWHGLADLSEPPVANQVRIERRVILRISPQPSRARSNLLSQLPRQPVATQLVERPMGDCLPANGIVGVSDRGSRLIIYMRDRSLISAQLEKACSPRDFYLGFYVERSDDGQLCVDRDRLMSRAGAKCRISEMNRLVAVRPRD
ncbi:hypothetical protein [Qipengyuania sp. 902]|uniref:hypothetical protein n=1 Tax=Qipengyuania sp. 902 TaxID=3417565 RepID=UPI003EBFB2B5